MAYAPGVNLGPLILIPEANRKWAFSGFTTIGVAWNDCNLGSTGTLKVIPAGAKAVLLWTEIGMTGVTGATDYIITYLRKNGSTSTTTPNLVQLAAVGWNLGAGLSVYDYQMVVVEVDSSGIFEYQDLARGGAGDASGILQIFCMGYYMGG